MSNPNSRGKRFHLFGFSCGLPALIEVMANQHLVEVLCCWFTSVHCLMEHRLIIIEDGNLPTENGGFFWVFAISANPA